jgi:hypothetical protein
MTPHRQIENPASASSNWNHSFLKPFFRAAYGNHDVMFEDLRALAQPGALIATGLVLLLFAAGDAAIIIAVKGWPPL